MVSLVKYLLIIHFIKKIVEKFTNNHTKLYAFHCGLFIVNKNIKKFICTHMSKLSIYIFSRNKCYLVILKNIYNF